NGLGNHGNLDRSPVRPGVSPVFPYTDLTTGHERHHQKHADQCYQPAHPEPPCSPACPSPVCHRRASPGLTTELAPLVDIPPDREPNNQADQHVLVEGVDVQLHSAIADHRDQESTDQRTEHRAATAHQTGATDDDPCDDVEL